MRLTKMYTPEGWNGYRGVDSLLNVHHLRMRSIYGKRKKRLCIRTLIHDVTIA